MITAPSAVGSAGWYGKLPVLGDFASRRLPHEFIEPWDQWLAQAIGDWQAREADWLDHYLQGPSLRFLISPGVLGDVAWAGVLMPSVDAVGRYFPLSIAASRPRLPDTATSLQTLLDWLHRLDDLALDALQFDWSVDTLEAALHQLGDWPSTAADAPGSLADRIADVLNQGAPRAPTVWIRDHGLDAPSLYPHDGLPDSHTLSALMAGRSIDDSMFHQDRP